MAAAIYVLSFLGAWAAPTAREAAAWARANLQLLQRAALVAAVGLLAASGMGQALPAGWRILRRLVLASRRHPATIALTSHQKEI